MPPFDPVNEKRIYQLTEKQAEMIGERVDDLLEDTEDWFSQSDEEFQQTMQSWVDILKALRQDSKVTKLIKGYKHICELS